MRYPGLPTYSTLLRNYPNKRNVPTKQLLDSIGGQVRGQLDDSVNTCATRISKTLEDSGQPIRRMPGLYQLSGAKAPRKLHQPQVPPKLYVIRVMDMKRYLETNYGPGKLIYDATKQPTALTNLPTQTQGIIVFVWSGPYGDFGAFGHVDLFRLWPNGGKPPRLEPACAGECHWWTIGGPMTAFLWETGP
jgi:hypothetical protein